MEGFDVKLPAAPGLVVGACRSKLVAVSISENANFLVIEVVGIGGLIGIQRDSSLSHGNGIADIEAIGLDEPAKNFEAFELGEVFGGCQAGVEVGSDSIAQGIALLNGLEVGFAKVAAHDQTDATVVVEESAESSGDLAEDGATEEAGFAIVLDGAFEGRDVEVSDRVAGVAGVADLPGVMSKHRWHFYPADEPQRAMRETEPDFA